MDTPFVPTPSPFTCDSFVPHVGEIFSIPIIDGDTIDLKLIQAEPVTLKPSDSRALGTSGYVRRDPFSLLFNGPLDKRLAQGIYAFTNEGMGTFKMSIVPVGPDGTGWLYEAAFN